jgi:hypothetical protein
LSDFVSDPMLSSIYGQKEIDRAKKWFAENEVSIFLPHRMDLEKMPCVTIAIGSNIEDRSLARLGDLTPVVETYQYTQVGKTIPYIIQPFSYISYDQVTGYFVVPETVDLTIINPGMVVIDPDTGNGFVISNVGNNGFFISAGSTISFTEIGILPNYRVFKARREIATFQEKITLGCHTHGDPNTLLWLYSILMYGLLRYREGVLESRNFQLSNIETSDMIRNDAFQSFGENVYSRFITVSGQVENTWIKAPKYIIEAINITDSSSGIKQTGLIIKGSDGAEIPEIVDTENEMWVAETNKE